MNCSNCNAELARDSRFCRVCGFNLSEPGGPPTTNSGTILKTRLSKVLEGRYRITKMVGRGGMAAVFLAEDLTLERPVAIKVLPPEVSHDERLVGRFEREARTAAKLDHPNIIPIYAVEHSDDLYYFVMKFVAGDSLDDVFKRGRITIEQAQDYLWEAARALGHAHTRGVVHRDIKPANIMLDHDGRVILTDFGISKAMQSATQYTGTGQVIGTPHYMSPEQAKGGEVDGRSDQYALGVVGFQMVTGRLPFADESIHAVIYKHVSEEAPLIRNLNPDCPPFIATAIHRAMRKKPDDRFPTMEAFAQAICPDRRLSVPTTASAAGVVQRSRVSSAPTEISQTTMREKRARKHSGVKVLSLFAMILLIGGGGYWSWSRGLLAQFGVPGPIEPTTGASIGQSPSEAPDSGGGTTLASNVDSTVLGADESTDDSSAIRSPTATDVQEAAARDEPPTTVGRTRPAPPREAASQPAGSRRRTGTITVNADIFGEVEIDGRHVGDTPVISYEVNVGQHVIRVRRQGCQDIVDTLVVREARETRQQYTFQCNGMK